MRSCLFGCRQRADQFGIDLCRGHGCLYIETQQQGSGHVSSPIRSGDIQISSGSVKFMQGMMRFVVNASESFHIIMHGYNAWIALTDVLPNAFDWPLWTSWRSGCYRTPPMLVSIQSCECSTVVVNWYSMMGHKLCNHRPAWNVQWPGTASKMCLCPIPTSSERPLG